MYLAVRRYNKMSKDSISPSRGASLCPSPSPPLPTPHHHQTKVATHCGVRELRHSLPAVSAVRFQNGGSGRNQSRGDRRTCAGSVCRNDSSRLRSHRNASRQAHADSNRGYPGARQAVHCHRPQETQGCRRREAAVFTSRCSHRTFSARRHGEIGLRTWYTNGWESAIDIRSTYG